MDFFWSGWHWVRAVLLYVHVEEGAQGLVDISAEMASFRLNSAKRMLYDWPQPDGHSSATAEDGL